MAEITNLDYHYDGQIRRLLAQLIRVFSHFKVEETTSAGIKYNRVPCRYGDASRMAMSILQGNSENVLGSAPMITLSIQTMQYDRSRIQDPMFSRTDQISERKFDPETQSYSSTQGNLYSVSRYMPVPYVLTIQADVWTTNTNSKLEILEQLFVLFNPGLQLTSNMNPLDWSNVIEIEISDINWSSRSIPRGTDDPMDVATLMFTVPVWISPPAKVTRQTIIQKIIADIHTVNSVQDLGFSKDFYDFFDSIEDTSSVVVTPGDYEIQVNQSTVILLAGNVSAQWDDIVEMQGNIGTTGSLLTLNLTNDVNETEIVAIGSITVDESNGSILNFVIDTDTLPSDTLGDLTAIINPKAGSPGTGLIAASIGQRYLLTDSISASGYPEWGITADVGDIIEYDGTEWVVSFNSSEVTTEEWITNTTTGAQWKWTGANWISSWQGTYRPGFWSLVL